jgi:hypothetical protein
MSMSFENRFKAVLGMMKVTPENYADLKPEMIAHLCEVVAQAEGLSRPPSPYESETREHAKGTTTLPHVAP